MFSLGLRFPSRFFFLLLSLSLFSSYSLFLNTENKDFEWVLATNTVPVNYINSKFFFSSIAWQHGPLVIFLDVVHNYSVSIFILITVVSTELYE